MKESNILYYLKKHKVKLLLIFYSISIMALYKIWKYGIHELILKDNEALELESHYFIRQGWFTVYRIIGTIAGVLLIKKYYKNFRDEFTLGKLNILVVNLFVILPLFYLLHVLLFNSEFKQDAFMIELFYNFFTGTFEELIFRALLLVGIAQLHKTMTGILISSLIFSLWHYDVVFYLNAYPVLFAWSFYAGLCYVNGASLLSLILFHFIWDQLFFGFKWTVIGYNWWDVISWFELLLLMPFIFWQMKVYNKKYIVRVEKLK